MTDEGKKRSFGSELIKGRKYRIIYKSPIHRKPKLCVAWFLELVDGVVIVSGRPTFGNAHIPVKWILSMRLAHADTPICVEKTYTGPIEEDPKARPRRAA